MPRRSADVGAGRTEAPAAGRLTGSPATTRQDAGEIEGTMLLLTRKLGENIRIGDDVKITIVEVKGNHVKLGIDAPPSVKVHREEIYERIQQENRRAQALRDGATGSSAPGLGERSAPSPARDSIPENNGGRGGAAPRKPDEEGQP